MSESWTLAICSTSWRPKYLLWCSTQVNFFNQQECPYSGYIEWLVLRAILIRKLTFSWISYHRKLRMIGHSNFRNLTHLTVEGNNELKVSYKVWNHFLSQMELLRYLSLSEMPEISSKTLDDRRNGLHSVTLQYLEELHLDNCNLQHSTYFNLIRLTAQLRVLSMINFRRHSTKEFWFFELIKVIADNNKRNLRKVDFTNSSALRSVTAVYLFTTCTYLEEIVLKDCLSISDIWFESLGKFNLALKVLDITNYTRNISHNVFQNCFENLSHLRKLTLSRGGCDKVCDLFDDLHNKVELMWVEDSEKSPQSIILPSRDGQAHCYLDDWLFYPSDAEEEEKAGPAKGGRKFKSKGLRRRIQKWVKNMF